MSKIVKIFQILLFLTTFSLASCSSDDDIEIKDAISVFQNSTKLTIDESLQNKERNLPNQINNNVWFGGNKASNNVNIENFAFAPKITKTETIWSGSRSINTDKKVFKPLIVGDRIYTLDTKGNLIARNLENYKKIYKTRIFKKRYSDDFANGKIYYDNDKIFATSGFNYLVALNASDGKIIWSKKIGSFPVSTPVANQNQIFVITDNNETYALNAQNGEINWIHKGINKNTAILGSADPVFYKNYVISSYSSGEIYILDQKTGRAGWVHDLNLNKAVNSDFILNDIDATPIVKDNVVYAIGNGGLMMAISVENGEVLWSQKLSSISDFWIAGDFIYLINNDNQLICLEKNKGGIKWFKDLTDGETNPKKKTIFNGLLMAGDNLIVSSSKNKILVISPINGKILQKKSVTKGVNHTPIIVNRKLYLHTIGLFNAKLIVMQ